MIMFKSPPQLLSQVHIDTKSSLELDHLRRLKQNLINEQNFIRQQFEEQLTLLKLRFKLELHSSQTDYELSQFHFKNKAEELFYRFRAIGATVPANLSTDNRHHAIVKNDHGNLSIETPTHLLIEILKIDRKLLDSLSAHLHTSYTCPKTPKDLRMKNEINRRVKTAIDSSNIKITNNEELINNLSKSLIDIATELCLINSEKHTELNEDTTNDPPITKHTISHCNENQSILDPLDDGDSPKNTKIPISTIISEGAVDNETELKTSRPRNVLEITAMLNADSGLESNQTQPIDSDEDNYSSDSSKGKSMITEDFKNKIDPLTPPASSSVLTRSKASTSRRASLAVSSVTMKTSWSGNTDDTNSASLEIKTKNNETSSDENVESSIKYFNAKMKLQKDNELKEIQAIIPKNLKKKSRKDPNKYNSANILKKDPIDLRVCPICERKFYRAEHLKRHLTSVHNKEKPFSCAICQKNFTRKDNLNQHQKRKHGQEEDRR